MSYGGFGRHVIWSAIMIVDVALFCAFHAKAVSHSKTASMVALTPPDTYCMLSKYASDLTC